MFSRLFSKTSLLIVSLLIAALAIVIVVFTPTGSEEEEEAKVTTLYFADNLSAAQQTIIDRFNAQYRGSLQVVPVNLPFTKFSTNKGTPKRVLIRLFKIPLAKPMAFHLLKKILVIQPGFACSIDDTAAMLLEQAGDILAFEAV